MPRWVKPILLVALLLAAAVSTTRGFQKAVANSQDFQWSGAHLIVQRIDPYRVRLEGDPQRLLRMTQAPNYLPLLYVLFAPLGMMPPVPAQVLWAIANILFALGSTWLAGRFFSLSRYQMALAACLLFASTPTRVSISNGQTGLFILFLWCLSLLSPVLTDARAAIAGISYVKFSFAPPVVIFVWLRAGFRALVISALPAFAGLLLVWLWLKGGHPPAELAWLLAAPFRLMKTGYFPNGYCPNLMDSTEPLFYIAGLHREQVDIVTMLLSSLVCFLLLHRAMRGPRALSQQGQVALLGLLSFALFKHHDYDSVVLFLPLCYLLSLWRHRVAQAGLLIVAVPWFVQRLMPSVLTPIGKWIFLPICALLLVLAALLFRLRDVQSVVPDPGLKPAQRPVRPVN